MVISDLALDDIRDFLATHRPERGGALYGPKNHHAVTHFEYDAEGATSSVSYVPSSRLIANVGHVERETGLQLKGIVHSHPPGMTRPSSGDERTVQSFFRLNPHFATMALPIVQQIDAFNTNESTSFIHWYRAERRASQKTTFSLPFMDAEPLPGVAIIEEELHILPIFQDVTYLLGKLTGDGITLECEKKVQHLKIGNAELVGLVAKNPSGNEFMYFVTFDYPVAAPIVFFQKGTNTVPLILEWDGMGDTQKSLGAVANSLRTVFISSSIGNIVSV